VRSVHSDRMGWGVEPRKKEFCGGRDARNRRRQHVRHHYARCRRSAEVEGPITSERSASEPERSHVSPQAADSNEAAEQGRATGGGGGGAKGGGQGEREPMPHVPDTVPGKRVTGAGARTEGREASRQTSEVGAVCGQAARTVLCGGRPVMGVPTAIAVKEHQPARPTGFLLSLFSPR